MWLSELTQQHSDISWSWQVYKREELQMIADLCIKHNVLCISDEVYEWLTYDTAKHIKIGKTTHL